MNCQMINENEYHEKYLLDRLAESEKLEFERHLEKCGPCQQELATQRTLIQGLRSAGRIKMKQEISRQLAAYGSESKAPWAQWMKVAAVLFVVVGTSSIYLVFRDQEPQRAPFGAREVAGPAVEVTDEALENQKRTADLERGERSRQPEPASSQPVPTHDISSEAGDIKTLSLSKSGAKEEGGSPPPVGKQDLLLSEGTSLEKKTRSLAFEDKRTTVTGLVSDQAGNPLPGATILIAGTNLGAATDQSGRYTFAVPLDSLLDQQVALECRFIGYETRTETFAMARSELTQDFVLEESALALDAVMVTRRADATPQTPMTLSLTRAQRKPTQAADSSSAPTDLVLMSTARSGQPQKPSAPLSFHFGDKAFLIRLVPSAGQTATDEKTGVPLSFPVTVAKQDSSRLEMDWQVPAGFSESRLEGAVFHTTQGQVLVVTLKQGNVYRIDLSRDPTEATLKK